MWVKTESCRFTGITEVREMEDHPMMDGNDNSIKSVDGETLCALPNCQRRCVAKTAKFVF